MTRRRDWACLAAAIAIAGCRRAARGRPPPLDEESKAIVATVVLPELVEGSLPTVACPVAPEIVITRDAIDVVNGSELATLPADQIETLRTNVALDGALPLVAKNVVRLVGGRLRDVDAPTPSQPQILALGPVLDAEMAVEKAIGELGVDKAQRGPLRAQVVIEADAGASTVTIRWVEHTAVRHGFRSIFAAHDRGARVCAPIGGREPDGESRSPSVEAFVRVGGSGGIGCWWTHDASERCEPLATALAEVAQARCDLCELDALDSARSAARVRGYVAVDDALTLGAFFTALPAHSASRVVWYLPGTPEPDADLDSTPMSGAVRSMFAASVARVAATIAAPHSAPPWIAAPTTLPTRSEIGTDLARQRWRFRACWMKTEASAPSKPIPIDIALVLDAGGEVVHATTQHDGGDPALASCLRDALLKLRVTQPDDASPNLTVRWTPAK